MTKMTIVPKNYNNIRAEIVELLKTARSAAARTAGETRTGETGGTAIRTTPGS